MSPIELLRRSFHTWSKLLLKLGRKLIILEHLKISLMEETLHQLIWSIPLYPQGFVHLNWRRSSFINNFLTASLSVNLSLNLNSNVLIRKLASTSKSFQISTFVAGLESTNLKNEGPRNTCANMPKPLRQYLASPAKKSEFSQRMGPHHTLESSYSLEWSNSPEGNDCGVSNLSTSKCPNIALNAANNRGLGPQCLLSQW